LPGYSLSHADVIAGGTLVLELGPSPAGARDAGSDGP
jgi:hypothetical protein